MLTQRKQQRENTLKKLSKSLRELWYNNKKSTCISSVPGEEKESRPKTIVEEISENVPIEKH